MKMTVKQWTTVMDLVNQAKEAAEEKYVSYCEDPNRTDEMISQKWQEYSNLCDIARILNSTEV